MNTQALKASSFRRVQARGLDFRVFDQGSGTPLLLLHRLPGRHADLVGRDPAAAAGRPWASGAMVTAS